MHSTDIFRGLEKTVVGEGLRNSHKRDEEEKSYVEVREDHIEERT
jgi:hypothetical protein